MKASASLLAKRIHGMESAACVRSANWRDRRLWGSTNMATRVLNLPILRWGQPYTSLEQDTVIHFATGETLARVSQANPGLLSRDMRHAHRAREVLTEIP